MSTNGRWLTEETLGMVKSVKGCFAIISIGTRLVILMLLMLLMLVMLLMVRGVIVHIVVATMMVMRTTVQSRVIVGVSTGGRTRLVYSFTCTRCRRCGSRSRGINGGIFDIHEWLAHAHTISRIGSTVIGVWLAVVRIRVIIGKRWGWVSLLASLTRSASRLPLRATGASLTASRGQRGLRRLLRLM